MIKATNKITGNLNASIIKQYPELEDITISPSLEKQEFKSEKYGFENVIVEAIPQKTLDIIPTEETQNLDGIFTEVNIDAIPVTEIAPELNFNATDSIVIEKPNGDYIKKITINKSEALSPENIKKGNTIFGVEGQFDAVDTRDATVTVADVVEGKTVYVNNQKVIGTIPDNGALEFEPSDNEQVIPSGVTAGGIVKAADITTLNEYNECLTIANSILGGAS